MAKRKRSIFVSGLLMALICVMGTPVLARDRAAVDSARDAAVAGLRAEIGRQELRNGKGTDAGTVDGFILATNGEAKLMDALRGSQQLGGPRWMDERVCQVKLEISGNRVADMLVNIASTQKEDASVSAEQVLKRVRGLRGTRFAAVGTSDGGQSAETIAPTTQEGAIDARFDDETPGRRQAISAAREDAQRRVMASLRTVPLDGRDVGSLLDQPEVLSGVESYLATRPVERMEFRDDMRVEVLLAVRADEVVDVVRANAKDVPAEVSDAQWLAAREELMRRLTVVWGSARTDAPATTDVARQVTTLRVPRSWTDEPVQSEGTAAPAGGSKLKAARAAEGIARQRLFESMMGLKLEDGRTVGEAARDDRRVGDAVARATDSASVYRAIYHPDGSATVKINLDLYNLATDLQGIK